MTNEEELQNSADSGFLGISPDKFVEVDVKELVNNETAIKMLLHYYNKLTEENKTQKNDINTYKTYVDAYSKKKSNAATSSVLFVLSNLSIAFAVNLLTKANPDNSGWLLLIMGGTLAASGLYFNFWKDK